MNLFIYLIICTTWCGTHNTAGLLFKSVFTDNPPSPGLGGWPHHRDLRPLLFSNSSVGSFTSHKNQISESAVRRDVRVFVLIRED